MERLRQLARELHALGLAAGEGGRGLAEGDVAEAHVGQRLQGAADLRVVLEELERLVHRQVQHVGDEFLLYFTCRVASLKRLPWQTSQGT